MSEEEIIENINEMIELIDDECYISIPEDIESIKGLLDLYNKEKEQLELTRRDNAIIVSRIEKNVEKNYISNDKIKDKIEEIKNLCINCRFRESFCSDLKRNRQCVTNEVIIVLEDILRRNNNDN